MNKNRVVICAVCAGTFLAAQTGLLNGRTATTHWSLAMEFQQRFRAVLLNRERMIVDEGDFITAGGRHRLHGSLALDRGPIRFTGTHIDPVEIAPD